MLNETANMSINDDQKRNPRVSSDLYDSRSIDDVAHEKRGQSTLKWWILLDVFFSWTTAYFLTFCVAPLETTLLNLFDWKSAYFSYIVASTFAGAIISPFCIPFLSSFKLRCHICSLLTNQIVLACGQIMFALILNVYYTYRHSYLFALLCVARFVIGIGMGSTDALSQSTIAFWFGASSTINVAFGLLMIGIETGTLTSRLAFRPFYNAFNHSSNHAIAVPFMLALFMSVISITINLVVRHKVNKSKRTHPEYFVEPLPQNAADANGSRAVFVAAVSTTTQTVRSFPVTIWLVIGVVVSINVVVNILYGCFVDPLHELFHFTEYEADMLLSVCAISIIVFAFPAAMLMDYFGAPLYWMLSVSVLMTLSMGLLAIASVVDYEHSAIAEAHMRGIGIVSIVGFSVALPFAIASWTLQAMVSPPQHAELIASISTTLWWILSILITNCFGWIRDAMHSYAYSILAMFIVACLMLIFAVCLWIVDAKQKGSLARCNQRNNKGKTSDQPLLINDALLE